MEPVLELFAPVIGQPMWAACRTHGSCMFLEFGEPHLHIREPMPSSTVPALRDRRLVRPKGAWSLLVEYCDYEIEAGGRRITEADTDPGAIAACFRLLEGQKLAAVRPGTQPYSVELLFDLGGHMAMRPTGDPHFGAGDSQWMLTLPDGRSVGYTNGGALDAD